MTLKEEVAALVTAQAVIRQSSSSVLAQLKDTSIPIEHRWEAFTELVENDILVNNNSYGNGEVNVLGDCITLYDDFYMDRHETLDYVQMYDSIMGWDDDDMVAVRDANLDAWREAVLASGYSSFTNDW